MDCDRDRHPPNKREVGCPIMTRGVCPKCHENWAKPASRARFARGCALAPSKTASWAYARPRKPLSFAPVEGHMGKVAQPYWHWRAAFRLANASTGRQANRITAFHTRDSKSTDDGFRLTSSCRRLGHLGRRRLCFGTRGSAGDVEQD